MTRPGRLSLALLLLMVVPSVAAAQKDTRETREATKFIGNAMTRQTPEEKAAQYRQAMEHLRKAMQEDAENGKVWLLAGTTLAALGEVQEADQAFDRAVALHPDYAAEIEGERENAWVMQFNIGIEHMDAQRYPEAIQALENAQLIYDKRPEALLNLGALYSNQGDHAKAEQAFRDAMEVTTGGELMAQLNEEQKAEWARFHTLAKSNVAQILAQRGIEHFQAERFDSAAVDFEKAAEVNPYARDYWFNLAQALWAMATPIEERFTAEGTSDAEKATLRSQLNPLYARIQEMTEKAREFDPNNEGLYLISARTHRMSGEIAPEGPERTAAQQAAMRVLEAHSLLTVTLDNIAVQTGEDGTAIISGTMKNMKLAENAPVTIRFTLLGLDGSPVGEHEVTVNAPAPEAEKPFEAQTTATGSVAGWRYSIGG